MNDITSITALHTDIYFWVTEYRGIPQIILYQHDEKDWIIPHIHFLDFQEAYKYVNAEVVNIPWLEFFYVFDQLNLALMYVEKMDGNSPDALANAFQFVDRDVFKKSEYELDQIMNNFMNQYSQNHRIYIK